MTFVDSIKLLAPAKVNLRLLVLRKREDGYHELETIMQMVDLCDEVEISGKKDGEISLYCQGEGAPEGKKNLAHQAAYSFLKRVKNKTPVKIAIHKRIPIGSGLGGGSSNAASVIMGLNQLLDAGFSNEKLREIGKEIGADVPFFIFQKTAIATGIGEKLEGIEFPKFWFVLVNPGFAISSAWAYNNLNLRLTKRTRNTSIDELIKPPPHLNELLCNDLEIAVRGRYPVIQEMKDALLLNGAKAALMSGSGPTVFGVFSNKEKAQNVFKILRSRYNWRVFLVRSI